MNGSIRIEVDAIDFQIACRRFNVRATITRERQMPVVDEFVLRLLAVTERLSISRMRSWFGFSESEMETVLVDLGRRSLVELEGDDVLLSPTARDLFRNIVPGGVPQLVEVAPLLADVWFDLVSRNMVPPSRGRETAHLVKLREQPEAREIPDSFAREAFELNFRDYARRIRRFPDADAVNLYSVSDVEGGRYGFQTLRAGVAFEPATFSIRPTFSDLADTPANFGKLTIAANEAWQVLGGSDGGPSTGSDYERMTGDNRLAALLREPSSGDAWAIALGAVDVPGFRQTVGATYLEKNAEILVEAVAKSTITNAKTDINWLRPNGSSWGRALQMADLIGFLRNAVHGAGANISTTTLSMPRSTHRSIRTDHKRLFDRGVLLPQSHLASNLEILFVPKVAAFVNVHLPVRGHSVPIGGIVTDPKRLARIEDRLRSGTDERWEELWKSGLKRSHLQAN